MVKELGIDPVFAGTLLGHRLRFVVGHYDVYPGFRYEQVVEMLREIQIRGLEPKIIKPMLPLLVQHPKMDFDSILVSINLKKTKTRGSNFRH